MTLSPLPQSGQLSGAEPDPRVRRARRRRRARVAAVVLLAAGIGGWPWLRGVPPAIERRSSDLLARLAGPVTPSPTRVVPTPTRPPTPTATPFTVTTGTIAAPAPFFAFGRPFDPPDLALPANSYLYGTNAEGSLLLHHGDDLGAGFGTAVLSIGDGTVVYAGEDDVRRFGPTLDFYGRLVIVRHDAAGAGLREGRSTDPRADHDATTTRSRPLSAPLFSLYGHLSTTTVRYGQAVRRGDVLGAVGMAGIALGPHLHLEVRTAAEDYEATRNPLLYTAPVPGTGAVVARAVDSLGRPLASALVGLFALDGGERWIAQTRTYPADHVHASAPWDENIVFSDLPPGRYALSTELHSLRVRTEFTVPADGVVFAVLAP